MLQEKLKKKVTTAMTLEGKFVKEYLESIIVNTEIWIPFNLLD